MLKEKVIIIYMYVGFFVAKIHYDKDNSRYADNECHSTTHARFFLIFTH